MCGDQVRFAGIIHPGLIGTAPSQELLEMWNKREKALVDAGEKAVSLGTVLHTRPLGECQPHAGLPGIARLWSHCSSTMLKCSACIICPATVVSAALPHNHAVQGLVRTDHTRP